MESGLRANTHSPSTSQFTSASIPIRVFLLGYEYQQHCLKIYKQFAKCAFACAEIFRATHPKCHHRCRNMKSAPKTYDGSRYNQIFTLFSTSVRSFVPLVLWCSCSPTALSIWYYEFIVCSTRRVVCCSVFEPSFDSVLYRLKHTRDRQYESWLE